MDLKLFRWNLKDGPCVFTFAKDVEEARLFIRNKLIYARWWQQLQGPPDDVHTPHLNVLTDFWIKRYQREAAYAAGRPC